MNIGKVSSEIAPLHQFPQLKNPQFRETGLLVAGV
jgi:hypothetical protein